MMHDPKQPHRFDPEKAARLEDPAREAWFPARDVVALLAIPRPARILDYGTGTARYAIAAAQAAPHAEVTAFDVQPEMLELARQRVGETGVTNVHVAGPDPQTLEGPFDRILALNVLHEVHGDDLTRIRNLLGPDGSALFVDWNAAIARDVGPPSDHVYTVADAERRLHAHGFRTRKIDAPSLPYHFVFRASAMRSSG